MAKYCTRCNKSIYTAWRTLDDKKYYHPHCFTCAVCNVILECVQECGVPNLKDIYCKKCYKDIFRGEKLNRWYHKNAGHGQGQGEQLMQLQNISHAANLEKPSTEIPPLTTVPTPPLPVIFDQPGELQPVYQTVHHPTLQYNHMQQQLEALSPHPPTHKTEERGNLGRSIPSGNQGLAPAAVVQNQFHVHPSPEIFMMPNVPPSNAAQKPKGTKKLSSEMGHREQKKSNSLVKVDINNNVIHNQRSRSRIPRPASSSVSKKPTEYTFQEVNHVQAKTKSKSSQVQLQSNSATKLSYRARQQAPRPQRSISMVQPRASRANNNVAKQISKVQCAPRPSKSFSQPKYAAIEQRYAPQRIPHQAVSKRQCAATFSNNNNNASNNRAGRNAQAEPKALRRPSEVYNQDQLYNAKRNRIDLPSPQAILSAVRRERSSVAPVSRMIHYENDSFLRKSSSTGFLPKRNFNITFDCPICISSLVPGISGSSGDKGPRGNVVTNCGHLFHRDCMENWLRIKGNKRCPICSAVCLPESLQPVFLECNVSAELGEPKKIAKEIPNCAQGHKYFAAMSNKSTDPTYSTLRFENDQLKRKYNAVVQDKNNYSFNLSIANSLQNAYEMECRNRLQLQWENKKLQQKVQQLLQTTNG